MKVTASIQKGTGSLSHNNRSANKNEKEKSWNDELSHQNIVYVDEDIKKIYEELFGEATRKYDKSQVEKGHSERQIKDYYKHIKKAKKEKLYYEIVVQVGNTDTIKKGSKEEEISKKILEKFCRDFEKRNPNFKVVQMIMHNDEDMISHVHIDFIPFSREHKRGIECKNSMNSALKAMGYSKTRDGFANWRDKEEQELLRIMKEHGFEFERAYTTSKHMAMSEYKEKKKAYALEAQKKISKLEITKKEVKINPITKNRSVTFLEREYDDLMKKHALEIEKIKAENEVLKIDNQILQDKINDFNKKGYKKENDKLEENQKLLFKELNKTNQKEFDFIEKDKKIKELEQKNLTLLSELNSDRIENFRLISDLENILVKLWNIITRFIPLVPSLEKLINKNIKDNEYFYLNNLSQKIKQENKVKIKERIKEKGRSR